MDTTTRLYYDDSYLTTFTAQVIASSEYNGRPAVALDRSAFYPAGGGQPADQGWIEAASAPDRRWPVVDVQSDNGVVWHILNTSEPLPDPDTIVTGQINWVRRFDHMQQHCGQHILTAAFIATCQAATVSFHLSERSVTIDLDVTNLNEDQVQAAEAWANRAVWANLPVYARFVSPPELTQIPLRKPPTVSGAVRVVSIGDIDHSACGGTHPARSGEVGAIVVTGWSRHRGMTRVEFVCGGRVIAALHERDQAIRSAASALSVRWVELPAAVSRLQETLQGLQRELTQTRRELDALRAAQWYAQTPPVNGRRVVTATLPDADLERLRTIASFIAELPGGIAIIAGGTERPQIVVACADDTAVDAREILAVGMKVLGGRGGGHTRMAQGGGGQMSLLATAIAAMMERASVA